LHSLPVELTEDAYHIRPSYVPHAFQPQGNIRNNSTDNAVNGYDYQPYPRRISSSKSSGTNLLKEYNSLFKRKENMSLHHKWDSEDDDECADIQSSASKSPT
jgi:hypothetical protein